MKPRKRIPAKRAKPRTHKTIIRLTGQALDDLRREVWNRDRRRCVDCNRALLLHAEDEWSRMELSHLKSRGACGDDTTENCVTRCKVCHSASHNAGGKPCPTKTPTRILPSLQYRQP
jgi:5-methylcytosine-specific restriction endonuclease McrA